MQIQNFALRSDDEELSTTTKGFGRQTLWLMGVGLYGFANSCYLVALVFAPLALCSALFATTLVFNAVFTSIHLRQPLTKSDVLGLTIIVTSIGNI